MDFPQISPDKSHLKLFILYNNRLFYFFNVNHVQLMKGSSCLELISCWVLVGTWYQMEPRSNQSTKASPPPPPHPPKGGIGLRKWEETPACPWKKGEKEGHKIKCCNLIQKGRGISHHRGFFFNPSTIKSNQIFILF